MKNLRTTTLGFCLSVLPHLHQGIDQLMKDHWFSEPHPPPNTAQGIKPLPFETSGKHFKLKPQQSPFLRSQVGCTDPGASRGHVNSGSFLFIIILRPEHEAAQTTTEHTENNTDPLGVAQCLRLLTRKTGRTGTSVGQLKGKDNLCCKGGERNIPEEEPADALWIFEAPLWRVQSYHSTAGFLFVFVVLGIESWTT